MTMNIAIGCDDAAIELKEHLIDFLTMKGIAVTDYGVREGEHYYYADVATDVALSIKEDKHQRGILLCGTGIGVSISANKVPGIRAALCHDCFSAERARKSNDAQIITMGSRVIGVELAKTILSVWLLSDFTEGPSSEKVNRISELEQKFIR